MTGTGIDGFVCSCPEPKSPLMIRFEALGFGQVAFIIPEDIDMHRRMRNKGVIILIMIQ